MVHAITSRGMKKERIISDSRAESFWRLYGIAPAQFEE